MKEVTDMTEVIVMIEEMATETVDPRISRKADVSVVASEDTSRETVQGITRLDREAIQEGTERRARDTGTEAEAIHPQ
jgi:hypothetical protein